jgi:hypothetical protein
VIVRSFLKTVIPALVVSAGIAHADTPATWDWQQNEPYEFGRKLDVFVTTPGRDTRTGVVRMSMINKTKVVCPVSVGTVASTDFFANMYPPQVVGNAVEGRAETHYLDIRNMNAILLLVGKRFNKCQAEQHSVILATDLDSHLVDGDFDISAEDVVAYATALAKIAHDLDMEIVQKDVPDLTPQLVDIFDFALTESCYQDGWCGDMQPYLNAGKIVLDAEYNDRPINWAEACEYAANNGISMILKDRDLTADLQTCP